MTDTTALTIHLVRHGQTDWNREQRLQGQTDIPLNQTGREQALAAALRLRNEKVGAVISSDLVRARDTAKRIADELGLELITEPALRERAFGSAEGRVEPELLAELGEGLMRYWSEADQAFDGGGESRRQTYERAAAYLRALLTDPPADEIVLVSHGGTLNLIRGFLEGHPVEDVPRYGFENGSVTTLLVDPLPARG